jgi:preprotein translocase subunit SecF
MKRIYTLLFGASMVLVLVSLVVTGMYGLNFGVDFKGGSVLEVKFNDPAPSVQEVTDVLKKTAIPALSEMTLSSATEKKPWYRFW